jgi:hypothetical protein
MENLIWGDSRAVHPYACFKMADEKYRKYELSFDSKKNGVVYVGDIDATELQKFVVVGLTKVSTGMSIFRAFCVLFISVYSILLIRKYIEVTL